MIELSIGMGGEKEDSVEECAELLKKAEMIKADPEKMKAVKEYLSKEKKAITSIEQLREIARVKSRNDYWDKEKEPETPEPEKKVDARDADKKQRMPSHEEMNEEMNQREAVESREEYY